jgi:hypothetical protein
MTTEEIATTVKRVAHLGQEPEQVNGDGRLVNALSSALGRRARKRLRKILEDVPVAEIDSIDFAAWRREVRELAHAAALDATGGDLRSALVALLEDRLGPDAPAIPAEADLSGLLAACPEAQALLSRVVEAWAERL